VAQPTDPASLSSRELIQELIADGQVLIRRQVELARLEARQQIRHELRVAELLSVAGGIGYAALVMLLVAAGLALGAALSSPWLGALLVAAVLLIAAGLLFAIGWSRRERRVLPRSADEAKKELAWVRRTATT
jgi:hypothetical protein